MEKLIFVHCGDIHLDARFTATGLPSEKAKQRRQELRDVFVSIIDQVLKIDAQILFICGDLFEHEYVSRKTVEFIVQQLNRISHVYIFIAPGNHDPFVANSYYATFKWPTNVHIFNNSLEKVELVKYNTVIYGAGFASHYQYESMIEHIQSIESSKVNVLLTHGTLDGSTNDCPYHPISAREIQNIGFDYAALGHIHKKATYQNHRIVYCGSPEPLGFDEPGEHGVFSGEISKEGVQVQFIPLNQRKCTTIDLDLSNMETVEEVEQEIQLILQEKEKDFIKILLKGKKLESIDLDLSLLTSRWSQNCYYLKLIDSTQSIYQLEEISKQYNLKGIYTKKMLEAIYATEEEEKKRKLYRGLYLGLDALDDNEVDID